VLSAEEPFAIGDHLFLDADGIRGAPRLPVGGGEVGPGRERGRMLSAEDCCAWIRSRTS
jgi:hypothetical protein